MRLRKSITISVILLVVIFVFFDHGERVKRGNASYWVVDRLDLGNGRSILILENDEPFEISAWYYEIYLNGKNIVPTTFLWNFRPNGQPEFEIISAQDNNVIGLIWTKRPGVVLVAYDFVSGASWPRVGDMRPATGLLDILQAEYPEMKLTLTN